MSLRRSVFPYISSKGTSEVLRYALCTDHHWANCGPRQEAKPKSLMEYIPQNPDGYIFSVVGGSVAQRGEWVNVLRKVGANSTAAARHCSCHRSLQLETVRRNGVKKYQTMPLREALKTS